MKTLSLSTLGILPIFTPTTLTLVYYTEIRSENSLLVQLRNPTHLHSYNISTGLLYRNQEWNSLLINLRDPPIFTPTTLALVYYTDIRSETPTHLHSYNISIGLLYRNQEWNSLLVNIIFTPTTLTWFTIQKSGVKSLLLINLRDPPHLHSYNISIGLLYRNQEWNLCSLSTLGIRPIFTPTTLTLVYYTEIRSENSLSTLGILPIFTPTTLALFYYTEIRSEISPPYPP